MNVLLNGELHQLAAARNVFELVSELQLTPATLLIEHNGTALHRGEWMTRSLCDGDRIELVRIVAGG